MRIKPIVFTSSVLALVAYILIAGVGSTSLVRAGSDAPTFKVRKLDGAEVSLSNLKGRVVFLNFWRTDCAPCEAEMPDLELVAQKFAGRNFEMMPVSLDFDSNNVAEFYI